MKEVSYLSLYQAGKEAFERGHYRQSIEYLESARDLVNPSSSQGGEVQVWLVTAYQAANRLREAISLVRKLSHHPDLEVRKQSKQLLYILEAPRLKRPPEWMTEIPDLTSPDENKVSLLQAAGQSRKSSNYKQTPTQEIFKVTADNNSFIWVALALFVLIIGLLLS